MLGLDQQQLEWVTEHLGHSVNIHKNFYRVMSSTIEKAKVAKLLILADRGEVAKFHGKSLDDLNLEGKLILNLYIYFMYKIDSIKLNKNGHNKC